MTDDMIDILILQFGVMEKWPTQKQCHAFARAIEQASRRAALEEAHGVCLAGVKWFPEPSKDVQFYINGTCHRLAAEISTLATGDTNNG